MEDLFASLKQGKVPLEFHDVELMRLTGWTEKELMETSAETVRKMEAYMAVRDVVINGGEVRFDDEQ